MNKQNVNGIRISSLKTFRGMPIYDIAIGPCSERGETHGNAKGIIAIGDKALGVVALGGMAKGIFAVGGVAKGVVAVGGLAVGGVVVGGCGIGLSAVGGLAIGIICASGGVAIGTLGKQNFLIYRFWFNNNIPKRQLF